MKRFAIALAIIILASPTAFASNLVAADPMHIGVGARPLGMGKAYVAVAEDGDALFVNPAGLGKADTPKLTSMYSSLMGDVNYMVIGGVYPQTRNSAIGAGAIMSSVSGIDLRDASGQPTGTGSWGNSIFFLSYGVNMEESNLQLGGSFKYYSQGGSGSTSIESASATGMGFDIGAIYSPSENISLGVSAQNPIGTKLTSSTGIENTIPSVIKVGGAYRMWPAENQKLIVALDADVAKGRPTTLHAGAEYQITPNIALRAGLDQDPATAGGTVTNPTLGLGIKTSGIEFNYAYHPYGDIAENATHYFSVGYVGIPKHHEDASLNVAILEPADKSIIYTDNVRVRGRAKGMTVVSVNGVEVQVDKDGMFSASVPVSKVGKKLVVAEITDPSGKKEMATARVLRLLNFADVSEGYWARRPIEGSSTVGLVQGYPDGTFRPERTLTRAELATLLVRAKGADVTERPSGSVFKDVRGNHWASGYIAQAVRMGLVQGYPDGNFRPNNKISKTEAITVLARYDALPIERVAARPYRDVATNHWAAKYIQAGKASGMLAYVEGDVLGVRQDVNRAEAIEMMSKTTTAARLIMELFSWDKGFEYERSVPALKASL